MQCYKWVLSYTMNAYMSILDAKADVVASFPYVDAFDVLMLIMLMLTKKAEQCTCIVIIFSYHQSAVPWVSNFSCMFL